jgi:hypothetical protein
MVKLQTDDEFIEELLIQSGKFLKKVPLTLSFDIASFIDSIKKSLQINENLEFKIKQKLNDLIYKKTNDKYHLDSQLNQILYISDH